jgi:hypothetical protein
MAEFSHFILENGKKKGINSFVEFLLLEYRRRESSDAGWETGDTAGLETCATFQCVRAA